MYLFIKCLFLQKKRTLEMFLTKIPLIDLFKLTTDSIFKSFKSSKIRLSLQKKKIDEVINLISNYSPVL
jgi:hypothetical protein